MRLRTKLFTALLLLFVVISLLATVGGYAVYKLEENSDAIVSDNFTSIDYTVSMFNSLDVIRQAQQKISSDPNYSPQVEQEYKKAKTDFESNFELLAANITEKNEAKLVTELYENYKKYTARFETAQANKRLSLASYDNLLEPIYQETKNHLLVVYQINKNAVLVRNEYAKELAHTNSIFIITLGILSVGMTFVFILYFPIYITRPLVRIREKLQSVANQDYSQQLHISSSDELGAISSSFNFMVNRLKEHEESSVAKLIYRNQHTQAVMNQLQEGVLVLDENLKIVAINDLLAHLMKIGEPKDWRGKYAPDMALKSNLMRKLIAPTLKPQVLQSHVDNPSETNLINEVDNHEHSRTLVIEENGTEYIYQVTQQKFYTTTDKTKQFAGYIITVKEVADNKPQISQMQTNAFINELKYNLLEWKNNEENEKSLQYINNLIHTTQKFNSTLNGRLNITNR